MPLLKWWQKAVFYQIYPRSFADELGGEGALRPGSDGIGDLPGIIAKLDYLQKLGVDAIWLSPHYPSPNVDYGYDISDYTGVAPEYGTLDDFRCFLDKAHQRGLHVITDLVLNHTSDLHPWFQESRSSRDNPKSDWYIWREGRNNGPPNNWYSTFGGPAWQYDPARGQYYYHFFYKEQPDLNWRNPEVRQAMWDAARFWLDMGVDGFRLDAIGTIFEDPELTDQQASLTQDELVRAWRGATLDERKTLREQSKLMYAYQADLPGMEDLLRELRAVVDEYDDRVLVGESEEIAYCGSDMLHLVFNFPLMRTKYLTPAWVRLNQEQRLADLAAIDCPAPGAWPCNTLGNHDSPRVYSRYGDGIHDDALARLHLALVLTLRGTPFLYNGEEIGMSDLILKDLAQLRDPIGFTVFRKETGVFGAPPEIALDLAAHATRDKNRTPMQWSGAPNAGFCAEDVHPWLPVNPNYAHSVNVAAQESDPDSLLNYYRRILKMRRETPALMEGDYRPIHESSTDYFAFLRETGDQAVLVVLNMSGQAHLLNFGDDVRDRSRGEASLLFSSTDRAAAGNRLEALQVGPFEVLILEIIH
ncbi:MAG: glycoside hydrolase family 13 protein [Omnitrophica WOR_2 bacterium]